MPMTLEQAEYKMFESFGSFRVVANNMTQVGTRTKGVVMMTGKIWVPDRFLKDFKDDVSEENLVGHPSVLDAFISNTLHSQRRPLAPLLDRSISTNVIFIVNSCVRQGGLNVFGGQGPDSWTYLVRVEAHVDTVQRREEDDDGSPRE